MFDLIGGATLCIISVGTIVAVPVVLKIQEIKERRAK